MKRLLCILMAFMLLIPAATLAETPVGEVMALLCDSAKCEALYERMTADMQAALPAETLAQLLPQLEAAFGAYQGLKDDAASVQAEGYIIHTQTLDMSLMDLTCTLALDAQGAIAGLNFTIAAQPEAIGVIAADATEEAVTIGETPWQLAGKLTVPASDKPVPAVVLVHGSGPSDMDESAYAVKPFRDLAEALAKEGIAVLRYDKRTYTYGAEIAAGDMTAFSVEEETIQDAIAAGKLLHEDPRIDPERIYVLGHSLGAMLAPRIASESDGLFCGMILACGSNASLAEIVVQQNRDAVAALPAEQQAAYQPVIDALAAQAAQLVNLTEEEAKASQFAGQSAYYYWEMLQHPAPAEQLNTLTLPALIINGSRDFQVNEQMGRMLWEAKLDMNAPWLTCLWSDVNHMMMKPDVSEEATGTVAEYATPCTVDASITEAIFAFINHTEEKQ